jgi:hypothetical protein
MFLSLCRIDANPAALTSALRPAHVMHMVGVNQHRSAVFSLNVCECEKGGYNTRNVRLVTTRRAGITTGDVSVELRGTQRLPQILNKRLLRERKEPPFENQTEPAPRRSLHFEYPILGHHSGDKNRRQIEEFAHFELDRELLALHVAELVLYLDAIRGIVPYVNAIEVRRNPDALLQRVRNLAAQLADNIAAIRNRMADEGITHATLVRLG